MIAPKTSRTTTPAGDTGWVARVVSGLGIAVVVAAGIVLSPGGTSAGQDWSDASPTTPIAGSTTPLNRLVPEPVDLDTIDTSSNTRLIRADRPKLMPRPATATPRRTIRFEQDDRPSFSPPVMTDQVSSIEAGEPRRSPIARILTNVRSQLERWSGVVVTSAMP